MGSPRPFFRRALALPMAALLAAGAFITLQAAPASAATVPPLSLNTGVLPTVQVDGVVWSQKVVGDTVYVGGDFTTARPLSGGSVTRSNVLAYNLSSGELISSFVANTNGPVQSVAAAPDGSRIYIAGSFTSVDGVTRNRVAALDPSTGSPVASFAPVVNGGATGVAASGSAVYVIGGFSQANGQTVSKAAAFSPSSGSTLSWKPAFGKGTMRAIAVSPSGSTVLVGGSFTSVGSTHAGGMAAISAGSGQVLPWAASKVVDLGGDATGIYSISTDGQYAYATGYAYKDEVGENSLEGTVSMRWTDGAINWIEDCHGDSYSSSPMNGILYVASHSHYCANVPNGFGELPLDSGHRATAFSIQAAGVLQHNTEQGPGWYQDFGGQPAPVLMNFFPELSPGTFTGQGQAAWSVASGGNYVSYGGEFVAVNGQRQTGLVRFSEPAVSPVSSSTPTAPPTTGTPAGPGEPTAPVVDHNPARISTAGVIALGPTNVAIKWSAPKGASADKVSGFVVKAYKGSKLVKTVSVSKSKRVATVSGLSRSTTYRIGVAAKNAHGTATSSVLHSVKTKSKGKNVSATKKPGKVKKPTTSIGKGKVRVRWRAASATGALSISQYQVRIALHGKTVKTVTVSAKSRSKLLSGLKHKTGYTTSVRAGSWAGWGAWSVSKGATTK